MHTSFAGGRRLWAWVSIAWLVAAAFAYLAPALIHGVHLGGYDLLAQYGLGQVQTPLHNPADGDVIQQMMPWTAMSWQQVHAGHLPLWNPYSGFGLPLAFNFQSASFSLPVAIGYLFPQGWAFTVLLVVKLIVAGTGVWAFCRVVGLGNLAATFAGTTFELSGAFTGWLGWPISGVFCWLGWILAAAVLVVSGRRPWRDSAFLALAVALAVLGGHPESLVLSFVAAGAFCAVLLVAGVARRGRVMPSLTAAARVLGAGVVGLCLAAPLLLPGLQVVSASSKSAYATSGYLPKDVLANLSFVSFFGLPTTGHAYFGPWNYYETAAYVGPVALVLAGVAITARWRRVEVMGLAVAAVVLAALVFFPPLNHLGSSLPLGAEEFSRGLVALDLVIAALAGVGLQTVIDRGQLKVVRVRIAMASAFVVAMLLALGIWQLSGAGNLTASQHSERASSFLWPGLEAGGCLVVATALLVGAIRKGGGSQQQRRRKRRLPLGVWASWALLALQVAFLLGAAPHLLPSGTKGFALTPGEQQLLQLVGSGRVAFGTCATPQSSWPSLGVLPEANGVYGISELAAYDPTIPRSWYSLLSELEGAKQQYSGTFCPSVTSASVARQFGVSWILQRASQAPPAGCTLAATIEGESLYSVPGGGVVTLQPQSAVSPAQPGQVLTDSAPDPATMRFSVSAAQPSVLEIHVSDLPGWRATIDGHPLPMKRFDQAMLQADLPAGNHSVTITYRPRAFQTGLALASAALLVLAGGAALSSWRAARRSRRRIEAGGELIVAGRPSEVLVAFGSSHELH